jgi:alpha-glucuronidase
LNAIGIYAKEKAVLKKTFFFIFLFLANITFAKDGSRLWLRYEPLPPPVAQQYKAAIRSIEANPQTETARIAINEFTTAFQQMTGQTLSLLKKKQPNSLIFVRNKNLKAAYTIQTRQSLQGTVTVIFSSNDLGFLYGTFHLLRLMQTQQDINQLDISEKPSYERRILNHWDNIDGTIERGYAGKSLWNWDELPEKHSPRYIEYARANASVGINGTVLNNVNANPKFITHEYLLKVAELANIFRPYGLRVYLSVNFSSPAQLGGLPDSDPLNPNVRQWWKEKVKEIYASTPDFGGFLVKASSEGQPGPQDFGRTHADGANMLAEILEPYHGIVMWRAFVYNPESKDRAKQAYEEFMPLDGKFRPNVIIQVKNGPVDFQPREPFSPLFGAMQKTSLMIEFQITQEYLGFSKQLVYLAPLYEECLQSDTYAKGEGSTVAKVTDGTLIPQLFTAIAGVANTGNDANWTGHHFAQANWYCFGRLAWNHELSSDKIADEWLRMTFSNDPDFVGPVKRMMLASREAAVNYMTPLGLAHLFTWNLHYGPEPWLSIPNARPDWMPSYYHKADSLGLGFDRTINGSNAVSQYFLPLRDKFNNIETCPENLLLWFHHVSWNYRMNNGKTLWENLCFHYQEGVDSVRQFQKIWDKTAPFIDQTRFDEVQYKLKIQLKDAIEWKDACLLYFQTFSKQPIPYELERPVNDWEELKAAARAKHS